MKTIIITLLIIPVFVFGDQHYLEYIEPQEQGEQYIRPLSDTIPVLVPEPQSINWFSDSSFIVNDSTVICLKHSVDSAAAYILQQEIIKSCACTLQIVIDSLVSSNSIILRRRGDWQAIPFCTQPAQRPQAYFLGVNPDYCVATGDDADGLYYGAVTLKQLIAQHEGNYVTGLSIYDYPDLVFRGNRMRYYATDLDSMKMWAEYFASLKLNKLILESGHFWTSNYGAMIDTFFNWCRHHHIEPIPLLQSFGHGGNVLNQNPACGEAVYRKDEHFCFLNDTARCLDDTMLFKKPELVDMGFDSVSGNNFTEWDQTDIGVTIFSDTSNRHAGESCVKISRTGYGTSRLWQDVDCNTNTLYRLSFFIKTQGVSGIDTVYEENPVGVYIEVYGNDEPGGWVLMKRSRAIRGTQDWQKVSVVFNSGAYTYLRVYVGMYYAQGTAWIDAERMPVIMNAGFEDEGAYWTPENGEPSYPYGTGHTDNYSCRIRRLPGNDGYTRVYQDIEVEPGYDYRIKVWVKTDNVQGRGCFCTAFWVADMSQYWRYRITHDYYSEVFGILMSDTVVGTNNWDTISTNWFSSVHCKKIRIKLALLGTGTGYFDDVVVEKVEKSLVNVDPTTSIKVTSETGTEYQAGTDYEIISGSNLTWPYSIDTTNTTPTVVFQAK